MIYKYFGFALIPCKDMYNKLTQTCKPKKIFNEKKE